MEKLLRLRQSLFAVVVVMLCSIEMAQDAHCVAEQLGFSHYTVNYVKEFEREVIEKLDELKKAIQIRYLTCHSIITASKLNATPY